MGNDNIERLSTFQRIDNVVVKFLKMITYLSAIALIGIMLVAVINVVGEKLAKLGLPVSGIPMSTEIITYLNIPVVFFAAAFVQLDTGHTRIDLIVGVSKTVNFISGILGSILGAVICSFVGYRGLVLMGQNYTQNARSAASTVSFPIWPFNLILSLGFFLLALAFLWCIVRLFAQKGEGEKKHSFDPKIEGKRKEEEE